MSRDDSVIIIKLAIGQKNIYNVICVQSHDNFKSKSYVKWYLSNNSPLSFTTFHKATSIANSIQKKKETEYGIMICDSKLDLTDIDGYIEDGKVIFANKTWDQTAPSSNDSISLEKFTYKTKKYVRSNSKSKDTYSSIVRSLTNKADANVQILNYFEQLIRSVENLQKILIENRELTQTKL